MITTELPSDVQQHIEHTAQLIESNPNAIEQHIRRFLSKYMDPDDGVFEKLVADMTQSARITYEMLGNSTKAKDELKPYLSSLLTGCWQATKLT